MDRTIKQKGIYIVDFEGAKGSEQKGTRIGLCVQNSVGNNFSPTTWIIPITSRIKKNIPIHHVLYKDKYPFLEYGANTVLVEQLVTRDKCRLGNFVGEIDKYDFDIIINKIKYNLFTEK